MIRCAVLGAVVLLAQGAATRSARADEAPAPAVPSITVEGEASRDVAPDLAVITLGVTTTRPTAQDAARDNGKIGTALIATIRSSGVADNDVSTTSATLSPVYDAPKNGDAPRIRAFQASNLVTIVDRKPETAGELAGRLLDQGANELQGISFAVANPEPLIDALRTEAAANAKHRAELYAAAVGARLGRVLAINPTPSDVPLARGAKFSSLAVPAPASVPLAVGVQRLETRVSITWALAAD